jgi:putative Holliday junction resolvase
MGCCHGFLGIDFGRARIGLAISETGQTARPIGRIKNNGDAKNLAAIRDILKKHFGAAANTRCCGCMCDRPPNVVCGVPLSAEGAENEMTREARRFGEMLRAGLGAEVFYHNEFLSSAEAERYIRETMGVTDFKKVKELVDGVAAAVILQSYLDLTNGGL